MEQAYGIVWGRRPRDAHQLRPDTHVRMADTHARAKSDENTREDFLDNQLPWIRTWCTVGVSDNLHGRISRANLIRNRDACTGNY